MGVGNAAEETFCHRTGAIFSNSRCPVNTLFAFFRAFLLRSSTPGFRREMRELDMRLRFGADALAPRGIAAI